MPKDQRLYMTFPNDFHRHPKLARLPVEVRWTFVEMNGEARLADNDGVFTADEAEFLWPAAHLEALVGSHPVRPLVMRTDDGYVIREYAEHQQTRAVREALSQKRALAGQKGGKSQASAKQVLRKTEQTEAEIETEIEITSSKELVARKRASTVPLNFKLTDEMRAWGRENTPLVDLDAKLPEWIDYWRGTGKAMKDWTSVWRNGMRKQQEFALRDAAKNGTPTTPKRRFKAHDD
jgi:hypothetical protein